jgi:hypothetical protein
MTDYAVLATKLDTKDAEVRARNAAPNGIRNAALYYVSKGVHVFPLVPGEKRPLTRHGLHDATTDPDQIRAWFTRWPLANLGFRTGLLFDVIDLDVDWDATPAKPNGYLAWAELVNKGLEVDILGRASTPRGGTHLFIAPSGDGNSAGQICPGVDYRGDGGYVCAPPSVVDVAIRGVAGRRYTWTTPIDFKALGA